MTDTGQVPGEGHPDDAGMVDQQGIPAPVPPLPPLPPVPPQVPAGYAFQDLVDDPAEAEDEELLLMPSGQGSWSDPQVVPQVPAYPADFPAEPVYTEYPQNPAPGYPQPAHPGFPEAGFPDAGYPQPAQPGAGFPEASYAEGAFPDGSFPPAGFPDAYAEPAAYSAGAHETGGRDSGALDLGGLLAPPPASPAAPVTAPRRPLHMGPPVPEATGGVVRSLADRGPAAAPAPAPAVPAPSLAGMPQPIPVRHAGPPTTGPEYLDFSHAEAAAQAAPQQPGEIPPQAGNPWASEPAAAEPAPAGPAVEPAPVADPASDARPTADPVVTGAAGEPTQEPAPEPAVEPAPEAVASPEAIAEPVPEHPTEQPAEQAAQPAEQAEPVVVAAPEPESVPEPVAEAPVAPEAVAAPEAAVPEAAPAPQVAEAVVAPDAVAVPEPAPEPVVPELPEPAEQPEAPPAAPEAPAAVEVPAEPVPAEAPAAPEAAAAPPAPAEPVAGAPVEQAPAETVVQAPVEPQPEPVPAAEPDARVDDAPADVPVAAQADVPAEPAPEAVEAPAPPVPAEAAQQAAPEAVEPLAAAAPAPADVPAEAAAVPEAAEVVGHPEAPGLPEVVPVSVGEAAPGYADAEREAVLRVMRERRDIRKGFRTDPIPHEVLLRVLEAAHTAPSVGHSQPWDFVVIRSAETRRTMHELAQRQREAYAKSLPKGRAKQFKELKIEAILDTPVNIVVTADPTRGGRHTLGRHTQPQMAPYSSALAVENLWLAARAEGLGVGWVSFFDEREMVRALGLPEHLEVVAYLCVGYVDEFPEEPELAQAGWSQRRPLAWVVHEETYGRRALPGEEPHDLLSETVAGIRPLDAKALGEAWERQKRMTKPAGALGMLEIISAQLSGLSRVCPPPIPEPAAVAIFAGDHGVHAQGVTPWPQEVTTQMVANFLGGGAVCNAFANQVGAEVCVIDVGVAGDLPATPGLLPRKVRAGTADLSVGPAMTREEAVAAIEVGIETARDLVAAGNKALLTGEMGIANTTVSAALISVFTGVDPAEVTGRGTGINDETHTRKIEVVRRALELHQPDPADPIGVLAAIGGLEHAAIVGLLLGGASLRTPVILDGVSAGAAALVARAIAPESLSACIAGHRSAEPGHVAALNKLGLRPLVDLDLRLGEGTGALLALPLVQSAARAMHEVATFDSAGVTEK
ncbi:nicotinate-nucleotide--dimethylbenzimidazole phosphoribosyltransferase [Streptomyces sp. NPDC017949]|uniref:nicotinate-nucleotide--dimethylbenzimidazole phosphoribosyltransferase n=1 Tax=Streptomyces sp. NPDC017949 TaxID=3365020 RepID=UPI00378C3BA3